MLVKYMCKCNCGNLRMQYSFQSTERFFFIPNQAVALRLHDTVEKFLTGTKFSLR